MAKDMANTKPESPRPVATQINLLKHNSVYIALRSQRMTALDGSTISYNVGDTIDASIVPHAQLRRLIGLGWIKHELVFGA